MATRTTSQQDKIDAMKQAENDSWQPTRDKQRCHDLAKEAEEAIRRNQKQEKGGKQ
jgi:hypothetical protein